MKILDIEKDVLLKPLQAVSGIVERRHTLPILSNVLLEADGSALNLLATDLEIQVSTSAPLEKKASSKYAITVSARKLQDILRALPENTAVSLDAQDSKVTVKAGKSRFNLQTLPAQDFPKLADAGDAGSRVELKQKTLRDLLMLVQYGMAQQDIRYYLNGLLMVLEADRLTVVATDGHRLAYAATQIPGAAEKAEVIIPRKAVIELVKLLGDVEEPVEVQLLANQVRFSFSGIEVISKVVDGKFPDYNRVIPTNYKKQFKIGRVTLLQALQRAAILSNEKFRGVRWVLAGNALKIVCTNAEQEEAEEELEVAYNGDALDIGFNITYLLDVLNNLQDEEIECAVGDANSSMLMSVPGNQDFKYVVMPMRI
ncbi:MAG TPA: DNA polymerase III subunit beta [Burkholderiales bacterium]|jgi:DNA polymerase-3 subunit beta|nr:DNA polymerase III subunit beta [Burkholderiales bacterium]